MSSSSSSARSSPMLTPYSSPMLTLAAYSQPHRTSSPAAHFHIEREADRVPPSIKRRNTSTPSLSGSTPSSSPMGSPYNFGIRRRPTVIDEVGIVSDDTEYHSDVSAFELQPVKLPSRTAPSVRPKLQRRDTPIPPTTSVPTDRSPIQSPSTAFQSNLRPKAEEKVIALSHHGHSDSPTGECPGGGSAQSTDWRNGGIPRCFISHNRTKSTQRGERSESR